MIWTERTPTPEEYRELCTAVDWQNVMNFDVAPEALKGLSVQCGGPQP